MTARRSFFWAAGGQALTFVVGFAASVIVARILSPTEIGLYVFGAAFVGLCTAITAFNLGAYIIGETDLTPQTMDCAFTLNAILSSALTAVLLTGAVFAGEVLGSRDVGKVMMVLAIQPLLGVLTFRPSTMLYRDMRFRAITLINVAAATAGALVSVIAAMNGESFMSQAWGAAALAAITALGLLVAGARYVSFRFGLQNWRAIATFGGQMSLISGAAMGTAKLSEIIIGRMLGLYALGIFSRASNLSNQLWDNVYGTATRVAFTQLSKDFRETGDLKTSFLHAFRLIAGVMCPLLAGLAALAPFLMGFLYGDKWLAAALPFAILLLAQIVAIGFGMNWELFVIRRETRRQTRIEMTRNGVALLTVSIASLFSVGAAALGRLFDNFVGLILYRKHVLRLSGVSKGEMWGIARETLLLTALATAPAVVLMAIYRWSHDVPLLLVASSIGLGVAAWYCGLHLLRHPLAGEIRLLARKLRLSQDHTGRAS